MKECVGIIVPIFNQEKYIEACINSLLKQKEANYLVICIDDCSTDNTSKILESYRNNKHIKILKNKKNEGSSYSKNKGIQYCIINHINYVMFVDSDDYIENDKYVLTFLDLIKKYKTAAIFSSFGKKNYDDHIISSKEAKLLLCNNMLYPSQCDKLFNIHYLKNVFFDNKLRVAEDKKFICSFISKNNCKIFITNIAGYVYRDNNESITKRTDNIKKNIVDLIIANIDIFHIMFDVKEDSTYLVNHFSEFYLDLYRNTKLSFGFKSRFVDVNIAEAKKIIKMYKPTKKHYKTLKIAFLYFRWMMAIRV